MSRRTSVIAVLLLLGTLAGALATCSKPAPGAMPDTVMRVEQWLARGDVEGARAELKDMHGRLPDGWESFLEGRILTVEGRFDEALRHLETANRSLPDEPDVFDTLQSVYARLGRVEDEGRLVEAYVARNPEDERGLFAQAVRLSDRSGPEFAPERAHAIVEGIHARREAGRGSTGRSRVTDDRLRKLTAFVNSLTGRMGQACAEAKAAALASGDPADFHLWADEARKIGRSREAVEAIGKAVEAAPDDFRWPAFRIQLYLEPKSLDRRRQEELLGFTEDLVRRFPDNRDALVLRARGLVRCEEARPGSTDAAKDVYQSLLERDPDDLEVLRNLAFLLYDWKQGGKPGEYLHDARRHLARYRDLGGTMDTRAAEIWTKLQERTRTE